MNSIFREFEVKFQNIEASIEDKRVLVNSLYSKQNESLNQKFIVESKLKSYTNGLNNHRQRLLDQIQESLHLEIARVDEAKTDIKTVKDLNTRNSNFKFSKFSNTICIRKLLNKEFKFGAKLTASQLIKYRNVLALSDYIKKETNSIYEMFDLNKAFILACRDLNANPEVFRLLIDGGADVKNNYGEKLRIVCEIILY